MQSNKDLDALMDSLRAVKSLQNPLFQLFKSESELKTKVKLTLKKAVYTAKERNLFQGHSDQVANIVATFSPKGDILVSARSVSFSPDGKILAIAKGNDNVPLRDLEGKLLKELRLFNTLKVSFSPDGQRLITAGGDGGNVLLWNLQGELLLKLTTKQWPVSTVSFHPKNQLLAIAGQNDTVSLWDLQDRSLAELKGHQGNLKSISFSADSQRVVAEENKGTVRWWNLQGQLLKPSKEKQPPTGESCKLYRQLDIKIEGDKAYLHDLKGKYVAETASGYLSGIESFSCSPDGKLLAIATQDSTVRLWDLQDQKSNRQNDVILKQVTQWSAEQGAIEFIQFNHNSKQVVTSEKYGTVRLWKLEGESLATLKAEPLATWKTSKISIASFSPDGKLLATAGSYGNPQLWQIEESLDDLRKRGCDWVKDYLNHPHNNLSEDDRKLCDGIGNSAQ